MMKFIELFAGIGGFRLGLELCNGDRNTTQGDGEADPSIKSVEACEQGIQSIGDSSCHQQRSKELHTCVWANEIDKYAAEIYRRNFGLQRVGTQSKNSTNTKSATSQHSISSFHCSELYEGDIRNVEARSIPDHDLLVGGFPCQAFSIAGKREGFADTRGTMFFEICRIAKAKRTKLLLLENVKGLLNHEGGKTFRTILSTLDELGYDAEWQVLNSKDFGVPQNRERVFIVGHLRGQSGRQVFPLRQTDESNIQQTKELPMQVSNCLRTNYSSGFSNETYVSTNKPNPRSEGDKPNSSNSIRRKPYTDDMRIRRLTPTECERLQGFPDGWTEGVSDTQRYKCLGNAVTVNVIQAIGANLRPLVGKDGE